MDRVKVEERKDLERDMKSNAIVNTNKSAYEMAKKRARDAQAERDKLREVDYIQEDPDDCGEIGRAHV